MKLRITEEAADRLVPYGTVSIAFRVEAAFEVREADGAVTLSPVPKPVAAPYIKDYDREKDEGPTRWAKRFDVTHWGALAAFDDETGQRIGGAVAAWNTPGVDMLEGRTDLAVLWDLRVRPRYRGQGVGRALFDAAARWAQTRGCRTLKVKTQNINVAACRFYARQGCTLQTIRPNAYPDCPGEAQLLWYLDLPVERASAVGET